MKSNQLYSMFSFLKQKKNLEFPAQLRYYKEGIQALTKEEILNWRFISWASQMKRYDDIKYLINLQGSYSLMRILKEASLLLDVNLLKIVLKDYRKEFFEMTEVGSIWLIDRILSKRNEKGTLTFFGQFIKLFLFEKGELRNVISIYDLRQILERILDIIIKSKDTNSELYFTKLMDSLKSLSIFKELKNFLLNTCVENKRVNELKYLLDSPYGFDINKDRGAYIHVAVENSDDKMVKLLLDYGIRGYWVEESYNFAKKTNKSYPSIELLRIIELFEKYFKNQ